jgi:cytochrome c oxidase subunit II
MGGSKDEMNRSDRSSAVAVLVVTAVMLSHFPMRAAYTQDAGAGTHASKDVKEIMITAKKYEYDPGVITVKQGEHVRLIITALDHDHGFKIDAYHIDELLKKGEQRTIEFTANESGTFPFQCSHFCGLGHKGMKGELIVERVSRESPEEQPDASAQFRNR